MNAELFIDTLLRNLATFVFCAIFYRTGKMVFDIDKKSVDTVLNFNWYITPYYVTAIIAFVFLGIIFSLTSQSSADFYQPSFTSRYTAWVVLWIILAWLRIFKEQLAYRTQDKLRKYRKARGIKEVKDSRHERPI